MNSKVPPTAHVCGGTRSQGHTCPLLLGLSPRVRGNLGLLALNVGNAGSIPARAGEPIAHQYAAYHVQVYPRACGDRRAFWR